MGFPALLARREADGAQSIALTDLTDGQLMPGGVKVTVSQSSLNYKDALAVTGRAPVLRSLPMVPGIDLAGTVLQSEDSRFRPGAAVLATGFGIGESHFGGFAERARLDAGWLVPMPDGLDAVTAMAAGTAGFTAMLSVLRLEKAGLTPDKGPVAVTGSAGGVGSFVILFLARAGYRVVAVTGRETEADYLKSLGAAEIMQREELAGPLRPLARERFAAGVDTVGGATLANLLSMIAADGAVAACGNAGGMDLPASVAPFILRGISLIGINSVHVEQRWRPAVWSAIADALDPEKLAGMMRRIALAEVLDAAPEILSGRIRGRLVVDVTR